MSEKIATSEKIEGTEEKQLESWKEIAAYLKRDVRTVIRWEKSEGLPVHRHLHQARSSVYAYPSEINAWSASRKPRREEVAAWRRPVPALAFAAVLMLSLLLVADAPYSTYAAAAQQAAGQPGVITRQVWTLPQEGGMDFGAVSHDGRYIPFADGRVNGELFVHDLMTGTDRRVTNGASYRPGIPRSEIQGAAEWSFSRDDKRLVYNWWVGWKDSYELRVIDLQGTGIPQFRLLLDNPEVRRIDPQDWSPDGNWIASWLSRKDSSQEIGLVSARDGSLRVLKSVDGKPLRMFFSPDGQYLAYDLPTRDTGQRDIFILATDASSEIAAVAHPSDDVLAGWSPDGTRLLFSSNRRGSRDLWALGFVGGKTRGSPEFIKSDVGFSLGITASGSLYSRVWPGNQTDIHGASFDFAKGQFLSTPAPVVNTFVGANSAPEWSPDGKYLAYVSRGSIGIRTIQTGQVRELSISPALRLQIFRWAPDGGSFIAAAAIGLEGIAGIYKIDAQSGQSSLVVSPKLEYGLAGLTYFTSPVLSPDGKTLYYVQVSNPPGAREFALVKRDLASATETELLRWPALGQINLSPDGQYIAAASGDPSITSNTFLIIPTAGGEPTEVIRRTRPQQPAMFVWGPDSRSLLIRIGLGGDKAELWRAFVDGAPAVKLETTVDGNVSSVRLHPDGRQIAFQVTTPSTPYEIWVTENFLPSVKTAK